MGADQVPAILDDHLKIQSVDRKGMLRQINEFPEQCETALGIARSFESGYIDFEPSSVFMTGTGDSALAADMAVAAVSEQAGIPVIGDHGRRMPSYVGENTLVIVGDYPGNGLSALASYKEARMRNAELVCITAGGKLAETALKDGVRVVRIPSAQISRTAIGYMFVQFLGVMAQYRVTGSAEDIVFSGIKLLRGAREALRVEYPASRNVAKQAAEFLFGKTPVIFGAPGYRTVVVERWKRQIGANSKQLALVGTLPDAATGEISGWEMASDGFARSGFVFLKDATDRLGEVGIVMERTKQVLKDRYAVLDLDMQGVTPSEKLLYGFYLADYVSYYLAILNEVDPGVTQYATEIASEETE